jgi:hypothetical protein
MALPTLLYEFETWTLMTQDMNRIEISEMKLLRPLAVNALHNYQYNKEIRVKLNIKNIIKPIGKQRLSLSEHVLLRTRTEYRIKFTPQTDRRTKHRKA